METLKIFNPDLTCFIEDDASILAEMVIGEARNETGQPLTLFSARDNAQSWPELRVTAESQGTLWLRLSHRDGQFSSPVAMDAGTAKVWITEWIWQNWGPSAEQEEEYGVQLLPAHAVFCEKCLVTFARPVDILIGAEQRSELRTFLETLRSEGWTYSTKRRGFLCPTCQEE